MKKSLFIFSLILTATAGHTQKIDSIFFHLYTDSLKKGTYNYINVDGKMSNGSWKPLTAKEIQFSSSACEFSGNELIIPADFKGEKITIKALLKTNPAISIEKIVWIKKLPDPQFLPTKDEIMKDKPKGKDRRN
jgi:hypothetical protein